MIAVDTNVLVHAHRRDSEWHEAASAAVRRLAESRTPWALPWPCVHEFLSVVTNRKIWNLASPLMVALQQVEAWRASPGLVLIAEGSEHWLRLRALLESGKVNGAQVHDARIAALCLSNGVRELWSADRDFGLFPELRTRNPLVE